MTYTTGPRLLRCLVLGGPKPRLTTFDLVYSVSTFRWSQTTTYNIGPCLGGHAHNLAQTMTLVLV